MPSPKSGSAGSAVSPAETPEPEEADRADPGEMEKVKAEQRRAQTGKYGSVQIKSHKPPAKAEGREKKTSWIEIELVDKRNKPVPGEKFRITLADTTVVEGTLDENGFARVNGIESGTCKVTFPEMDGRSWEKA